MPNTTRIKARLDHRGKVVGYIDELTGKEYGFPVIFGRKKNPYGNGWIMNSQEALDMIAEDKDLKGNTLRVFIKVCARVDFENWVHLPLKELSEELDIDQADISKNIKLLVKKGILIKSGKIGRSYAYRLNPDFGWKGKVTNLEEYRREQEEEFYREQRRKNQSNLKVVTDHSAYNREIRRRLYGEEYADGFDMGKLPPEEQARLHERSGRIEREMKESGEWDRLQKKYFPNRQIPNQIGELIEFMTENNLDLENLKQLMKKSGTR